MERRASARLRNDGPRPKDVPSSLQDYGLGRWELLLTLWLGRENEANFKSSIEVLRSASSTWSFSLRSLTSFFYGHWAITLLAQDYWARRKDGERILERRPVVPAVAAISGVSSPEIGLPSGSITNN